MVDKRHEEYMKFEKIWQKVNDCVDGQDVIKQKGTVYLPKLNGQDDKSYNAYKTRAQYINFTGRTLNICLGQVFRKNPVVQNIDEDIYNNIDLNGHSLDYFSRDVLGEVLRTNRGGVLVDWSEESGRPYLVLYPALNIINWREEMINGEIKLSLVVLEGYDSTPKEDDIYDTKKELIWRVLRLIDNVYTVQIFKKAKDEKGVYKFVQVGEDIQPKINNKYFDFIPFCFVTSSSVTTKITHSAMYDFANVNLGHYINSADYENMLHWTGCKTHVTKGWGKESLPLGGSFDLPVDGNAFILEASSDSGLKDAMKDKESQMSVLGATLISGQGRYVASAQTATINSQGEYATLSDLANSLSDAMTKIMKLVVEWQGANSENVSVEYNTDFELAEIDSTIITSFMGAVQSGFLSWEVFFYNMKNKELYPPDWTIENEQKAIEEYKKKKTEVIELEDNDENLEVK